MTVGSARDGVLRPVAAEQPDDRAGGPSSWQPIDLAEALAGGDLPAPVVLRRTDGVPLLYLGRVHWFQGESESCKTWAAIAGAAQVLDDGGRLLWIDFEDDERSLVARLRACRVPLGAIAERVVYVRPGEPLQDRHGRITAGGIDFAAVLNGSAFDLAVIDGVTEAMLTEGLDLLDNGDVAAWMRRLPKRVAATGAAVVCLDHVTKSREERGRYAIGGQHKLAGITGAAFRFDVVRTFARPVSSDPTEGAVTLTIVKDRPGYLRARAVDGHVATLELTGWPDGGVSVALVPPDATPVAPDLGLCGRIAEYLGVYDGASQRKICEGVPGKDDLIRQALRWMAEEPRSWLRIERSGQTHRHFLTDAARETFP